MRIISQDGTIDVPYEHTTLISRSYEISRRAAEIQI